MNDTVVDLRCIEGDTDRTAGSEIASLPLISAATVGDGGNSIVGAAYWIGVEGGSTSFVRPIVDAVCGSTDNSVGSFFTVLDEAGCSKDPVFNEVVGDMIRPELASSVTGE